MHHRHHEGHHRNHRHHEGHHCNHRHHEGHRRNHHYHDRHMAPTGLTLNKSRNSSNIINSASLFDLTITAVFHPVDWLNSNTFFIIITNHHHAVLLGCYYNVSSN